MDLSTLNPAQREAVTTTEGPLLVLAGAGSGKTRVITHRIAYLLAKKKVPPEKILAVTFTNRAAQEMASRAVALAGPKARAVTISTFHSFGAKVLQAHLPKMGWPKRWAIADSSDQVSIVRRAMRSVSVDERAFDARRVLSIISRAKNSFTTPQPAPEGQKDDYDLIAAEVFPRYERALKSQGSVDFDDLIVLPARWFEAHPEIRKAWAGRYSHVMVDEYQDTNVAQLRMLQALASEHGNACVVGDDDQCIYSWRGAEVRNILEFERAFAGAKVVPLLENYRSTPEVLHAANRVIARNPNRRDKAMIPFREKGARVQSVIATDEFDEARYVARRIDKAVGQGQKKSSIAVLYRTNGQSQPLEEALREVKIPYRVVGGSEYFDKKEVKDALAYLKLVANPRDDASLLRIINTPSRGIGDATMERLVEHASSHGCSVWDAVTAIERVDGVSPASAEAVRGFATLVTELRAGQRAAGLKGLSDSLFSRVDFLAGARNASTSGSALAKRAGALQQLQGSLQFYAEKEGKKADLISYLNRLALDSEEDDEEDPGDVVTLMTLHAAKGLEWPLVFLVGMEEDLLPHGGMQGELPNPEEERRLCYVGFTRARDMLVLTRAAERMKRGKLVPRTPSRFLEDLPEAELEIIDLRAPTAPPAAPGAFIAGLRERLKAEQAAKAAAPPVPPSTTG